MRSRARRVVAKLAVLTVTLMACAAAVEVLVRLTYKPVVFRIDRKYYQAEPWPFSFRFIPEQTVFVPIPEVAGGGLTVPLNRHGFRGPDLDELTGRRLRVVSIGDSFTFGWGLHELGEQCVVGAIDDYRRARPGSDVGLSVVAEPGWGMTDYFFAYVSQARAARPQLVVLGFFCGDDLASPGSIAGIGAGAPPAKPWSQSRSAFRSATLEWVRGRVRGSPVLTRFALAAGYRPSIELMRFLRSEPEPIPTMWRETLSLLSALHAEIARDGGRLAIVSYPSLIQVFAYDQLDDARFDYRLIDERLGEFCRSRGITFVPLLPALIADGRLDLFFARDRHLTPRGHAVCRQVIVEALTPILDEIDRSVPASN